MALSSRVFIAVAFSKHYEHVSFRLRENLLELLIPILHHTSELPHLVWLLLLVDSAPLTHCHPLEGPTIERFYVPSSLVEPRFDPH